MQVIAVLLWMGTCITMAFTVVDAKTTHVPGTKYCAYTVANETLLANGVVFLGFDTFVFLAISHKIASSHLDVDVVERGIKWRTVLWGRTLPRLSRVVIRGGQKYYLWVFFKALEFFSLMLITPLYRITLCLQVPVLVLTAMPSVSPNVKLMVTFPLGCLAASMACRVFRNLKMSDTQDQLSISPASCIDG